MKNEVSRRGFLKGAAAGLAIAGATRLPGLSKAEEAPQDSGEERLFNRPEQWNFECDVVVIGSGTASYAAIRAADKGLDVIVVEAYASGGGATGFSGGGAWIPMNKFAVAAGDTREDTLTYLKNVKREIPIDEKALEAFVDNGGPMVDYMEGIFAKTTHAIQARQGAFGDYQAEWPGGTYDARRGVNYGGVKKWKESYLEAITMLGGKIMYSTKATDLVWRYDENQVPEVLGVLCETKHGPIAIKARKGVVCGAGGFEWNDEMKNAYLAVETPYACSLPTNDGTMLKAVMALGPKLMNMSECYGQWTFRERADVSKAQGSPCNIIFGHYFPRQIVVNRHGRRFCNESASYDALWLPMGAFDTFAPYEKTNVPAWQIFDQKFVDEIKGFAVDYYIGDLENGVPPYAKRADSLEELADIIGVNKENLIEEVARWNRFCEEGEDKDYHRGEQYMDQMFNRMRDMTMPLQSNLGPIDAPPYYALEIAPNTLGTVGGPSLNEHAQCMHITEKPIGKLYACGNFSGFGAPGRGYPGAGGTIGPGLVMAYIAAGHIADNQADWKGPEIPVVAPDFDVFKQDGDDGMAFYEDNKTPSTNTYKDGKYSANAQGMGGSFEVTVTISGGKIAAVDVGGNQETAGIGDKAFEQLTKQIVYMNSTTGVDAISGATISSNALLNAVDDCLKQAAL